MQELLGSKGTRVSRGGAAGASDKPLVMIKPALERFLMKSGADEVPHSGRHLLDHLVGVYGLLKKVQAPEYLCEAGLFHSIYRPQCFMKISSEQNRRQEVRDAIGEKAESIVWAYNKLPRPYVFESSLRMGGFAWLDNLEINGSRPAIFSDLIRIECANLLEQKKLESFPYLLRYASDIGMLAKSVGEQQEQNAKDGVDLTLRKKAA